MITGGASGIGRAVAEVFGEAGYRLVVAALASQRCSPELETIDQHLLQPLPEAVSELIL